MAENQAIQEDDINTEEDSQAFGYEIISWEIPEYRKHARGKWWYLLYGLIAVGLTIQALVVGNFLFALILVIGSLAIILNDARHPKGVPVIVTTEGIILGNNFYDYDTIKHFSVVYKPGENLKRIYFVFKSVVKHRLSIGLEDTNPLFLRQELMKYLPEDLNRTDEPASEVLARMLKL